MGLSIDSIKFLLEAKKSGVCFDQTLMLGRQQILAGPERIESLLREYGHWPPPGGGEAFQQTLRAGRWRAEAFFGALGAKEVASCDASSYEGATLVHDLNQPIPAAWEEKFDVVLDGGTFEHVFNFPTAIASGMRMVKTGGHLLMFTPTNNYGGHGFYQFSPELLYRVLSPENGFQVLRMVAVVADFGQASLFGVKYPFPITGPWYAVRDPAEVGKRVQLINDRPVVLMVLAKKICRAEIFAKTPQQSDYVPQWQDAANSAGRNKKGGGMEARLKRLFSETFCRETLPRLAWMFDPLRLRRHLRKNSFKNREFYKRDKN